MQHHPTLAEAGLADRLVDPADASRTLGSARPVRLWCDGEAQGMPLHRRVEYDQTPWRLGTGANGCPACGGTGRRSRPIAKTHPAASRRLVDRALARQLTAGSTTKVAVWCDGTVGGGAPHERIEYDQTVFALTRGRKGCPSCGAVRGAPRRSVPKHRLVDPSQTGQVLTVWCDGAVQGRLPHPYVTYNQTRRILVEGHNGCPTCGGAGAKGASIASLPLWAARLVDPAQATLAAGTAKKVLVWCDGLVQGNDLHERTTYEQQGRYLTTGRNGCPICGGLRSTTTSTPAEAAHVDTARFVDPVRGPAAVRRGVGTVVLRCDGTVQGLPGHEVVTYQQAVSALVAGGNDCPACAVLHGTVETICRTGHGPVTYRQTVGNHARGIRQCPICDASSARSVALADASLAARMADPAQAATVAASSSNLWLDLWCNGTTRGRPAHPVVRYRQRADHAVAGHEACPSCQTPTVRGMLLADRFPSAAARLVDRELVSTLTTGARFDVWLWCDGLAQDLPAHERITYRQRADNLGHGYNGCPECRKLRRAAS